VARHTHCEVAIKAGQRTQSVLQSEGVAEEAKTAPFVSGLRTKDKPKHARRSQEVKY
jgi:hypothetical protein